MLGVERVVCLKNHKAHTLERVLLAMGFTLSLEPASLDEWHPRLLL